MKMLLNILVMLGIVYVTMLSLQYLGLDTIRINSSSYIVGIPINVTGDYKLENITFIQKDNANFDKLINIPSNTKTIYILNLDNTLKGKNISELDLKTIKDVFLDKVYSYYGIDGKLYTTRYYSK